MVISSVELSKRINGLARMALVFYSVILIIMPLTFLHVEDTFSITGFFASQSYQTDLIVLIHEALYAHLRNATDYLYGSAAWLFGQLITQVSETLLPDGVVLTLCLLSLNVLATALSIALRYVYERGKTLSRTFFCYRMFLHSPPAPHSL